MKIAIDKETFFIDKKEGNEYIYLFDDEPLKDLLGKKIHCLNWEKCDYVDINLSRFKIDCIKKSNVDEKDYDKMTFQNFKIAIIIPNYNYADCLEKCLSSVLNQTYKNFEIIFVDDMSTDNSVEIASKLLKPPHKVIKLKQKRFNGGARNEAYLHISDDVDYLYYIDSDDWLKDVSALENVNKRLQSKPDVLFVGMDVFKKGQERVVFIPDYKNKYDAFDGWSGSCGKVIKKELALRQECLYNEGTLKEDKNHHCRICYYMKSFELLKTPIYVWNRENSKSVTTVREKIYWGTSTIRNYADAMQFYLSVKGGDKKIDELMENRLRAIKQDLKEGGDRQY